MLPDWLSNILAAAVVFIPILALIIRTNANSTRIIVERYETESKKWDATQDEVNKFRNEIEAIKVNHAEERGGLKQKISDLEQQIKIERESSEKRSADNTAKLVELETRLQIMTLAQKELEARIVQVSQERESLKIKLDQTNADLEQVRIRETELLSRVVDLSSKLADRERELALLQQQLNGPTLQETKEGENAKPV